MTFLANNLSTLSTMTSLISTGTEGISTFLQSRTDARNAEERANADFINADIADQVALSEEAAAASEAEKFTVGASARRKAGLNIHAGSGFLMEGSPMLVDDATVGEIEHSVATIIHAGGCEGNAHSSRGRSAKAEWCC